MSAHACNCGHLERLAAFGKAEHLLACDSRRSTAAREIAEYEADLYKAKRDARAARKMFKTTLARGLLR